MHNNLPVIITTADARANTNTNYEPCQPLARPTSSHSTLVTKYRANIVRTDPYFKTRTSLTFLWILTHYTVRNILFEATFFDRTSFFEVRVSHNIVFTTALLGISIVIGHVTLRSVLCAGWSGSAFSATQGSLHGVSDSSKIVHFEMILPVSH